MRAQLRAVCNVRILHAEEKDQFDEDKCVRRHVRQRDESHLLAAHLDERRGQASLRVTLLQKLLFLVEERLQFLALHEDGDGKNEVEYAHSYPMMIPKQ